MQVCMLIVPVQVDLDELAERERKKGPLGSERVVWKKVTWWPYLDCVLNMEPYHDNRRVAVALAVDWVTVDKGEAEVGYHRLARGFNLVHALLSTPPLEDELNEVPGLPVTDLIVQQNFFPNEPAFSLLSVEFRACWEVVMAFRLGKVVAPSLDDPMSVFHQAMAPAKPVVEELMLPEGYERELKVPAERKVVGITTESLLTEGAMRDKGWMIQAQRPFWEPLLVVHYHKPGGTYWRIVVFDRDGRKLMDRRPRWRFVPWVEQLEEHGVLDGTVEYLGNEFWRLDKERMNGKDKAERDRPAAEELVILGQLDRLLPTYKGFDRKFRFDLFSSASLLCLSVNDYSRGMRYAKAATELAPNDGRPHISWALNAVHFDEMRDEAVGSCLLGVRLPPIAGDQEAVSTTLRLMKLELEGEKDASAYQSSLADANS